MCAPLQVAVHLRIASPGDLASPLLGLLPCAELAFEPALSAGLNRPLTEPLHALLGSAAFRAASGGSLTTLRCLPGEALDWSGLLAPYTALDDVSFDAGDSWLTGPGAQLRPGLLGRFSRVCIAGGSIGLDCASAPLPRPVLGPAGAWGLETLLEAIEPALESSRINTLELQGRLVQLMCEDSPPPPAPGFLVWRRRLLVRLARNVQHTQGAVLPNPDAPAHLTAIFGCLSGTFTRPTPGNANDVLIHIQRHV